MHFGLRFIVSQLRLADYLSYALPVPSTRLELALPLRNVGLNHARLPIPPRGRSEKGTRTLSITGFESRWSAICLPRRPVPKNRTSLAILRRLYRPACFPELTGCWRWVATLFDPCRSRIAALMLRARPRIRTETVRGLSSLTLPFGLHRLVGFCFTDLGNT